MGNPFQYKYKYKKSLGELFTYDSPRLFLHYNSTFYYAQKRTRVKILSSPSPA